MLDDLARPVGSVALLPRAVQCTIRQDQKSTNVDKKVSFQTPFKEHEVTARDVSTLFSGEKSSLNDKNN